MVKRWGRHKQTEAHKAKKHPAERSGEPDSQPVPAKKTGWSFKKKLFVFGGIGLLSAVAGFVTYYSLPMRAEPRELGLAKNMITVRYEDAPGAVVLAPLNTEVKKGIVLYPAARVEPAAYAYKMSQIAQSGIAVVIVKPLLNLPSLDWNQPGYYTGLYGAADEWYVGGHSLGGVKACQAAGSGSQFKGLILFGATCPGNATGLSVPVLSIGGSTDGLTTPAAINDRKASMPSNTRYEMIEGLNHAGFGDYGAQGGDGDMTIGDAEALQKITLFVTRFIGMTAP